MSWVDTWDETDLWKVNFSSKRNWAEGSIFPVVPFGLHHSMPRRIPLAHRFVRFTVPPYSTRISGLLDLTTWNWRWIKKYRPLLQSKLQLKSKQLDMFQEKFLDIFIFFSLTLTFRYPRYLTFLKMKEFLSTLYSYEDNGGERKL